MNEVLALLRESGAEITLGRVNGRASEGDAFTRSVYSAVRESGTVVVLDAYASETVRTMLADTLGDACTILTSPDTYSKGDRKGESKSASDVLLKLQRHNEGANNKADKYGAIKPVQDGGILDGDTLVGFLVESA